MLMGALLVGSLTAIGNAYADAQTELQERQILVDEINKRMHNKAATDAAIRAGQERTMLCGHCHGIDGNSLKPDIPNLASQNPAYIVEQVSKFRDGRRKSFVMEALAKTFEPEEVVNLAIYFTSQTLTPQDNDPLLAAKGKRIFDTVCAMCHGANGRGEKGYARLAGQKIEYVKMTLKRFRANANKANDFDETKRTNARMEQVTQRLSDDDIEGLANYIAQLK